MTTKRVVAKKGDFVVLLTDKWDHGMQHTYIPLGAFGEVVGIEPATVCYRYDVSFGDRSMPLDRGEFAVVEAAA